MNELKNCSTEDLWIELGRRYESESPISSAVCKNLPLVVLPQAACDALKVILAPILSNSKVYKKGIVLPEAVYHKLTPEMREAMQNSPGTVKYSIGSADLKLELPAENRNHPFLWSLWTALGGSVLDYPFSSVVVSPTTEKLAEGDVVICCSPEQPASDDPYAIFATIVKVDRKAEKVTLRRYQRQGQLFLGEAELSFSDVNKYYRTATEREERSFGEFYGCDKCGKRVPFDDAHWLTSSYGICDDCYAQMPEEEKDQILESE